MGRSSVLHKNNLTYNFLFEGFNLWKHVLFKLERFEIPYIFFDDPIQYIDLSLSSIYRAPFSIYRDELRRTNSGTTSGFDGVHKAQTKGENTLCTSQHNTKLGLYIATCVNNAVEFCSDLATCCYVSDANKGTRSIK